MTRRLAGSSCAMLFGVSAVAAFVSGCASEPEPDSVVVCGREISPTTIVRADDGECDRGNPGVGRYVMQLPDTQYEYVTEIDPEDGMPYSTAYPIFSPLIVGDVGRPMGLARDGNARNGFVAARPGTTAGSYAGFARSVTVPAAAAAGSPLGGSTISRGGLGVTGGGAAGYGAVGSSGGS